MFTFYMCNEDETLLQIGEQEDEVVMYKILLY
jgi:hypothetical protein